MAVAERILDLAHLDARSDRALVRDAQAGRSDAAAVLIRRYYPRVYSFVSYLTGGRGSAEDLTQEVFTRALSALDRFNGTYRFGPWLLRIARNLTIDESRRDVHRPRPTDPSELPQLEVEPRNDNVWDHVSADLATSVVHRALATLPPRQRAVLVLREIDGMSYADIAQVVGTNERGVEGTLRRARARFRLEVARAEAEEGSRAVCKRTLRLIAGETESSASSGADVHLSRCPACRARSSSIRSADKIFGVLPPVAIGGSGLSEVLGALPGKPKGSRGLLELLRQAQAASPVAQVFEVAASLALAAAVSIASVAGNATRVASSARSVAPRVVLEPAPAALEAAAPAGVAAQVVQTETKGVRAPAATPAGGSDDPAGSGLLAALPPVEVGAGALGLEIGLTVDLGMQLSAAIESVEEAARTAASGPSTLPLDAPVGGDLPIAPEVTATVAPATLLPRRRLHLA